MARANLQPGRHRNPHETTPMSDNTKSCPATNRNGDPCGHPAGWGTENDSGPCKFHGGAGGGDGPPEGNTNAAKHGAWSDSFVTDFLRDDEIERVRKAEDLLGEPETAQDVARTAAAIALEQFRRTGDDRFLRRYESICDTFGIAPADELEVSGEMDVNNSVTAEFVTYGDGEDDE